MEPEKTETPEEIKQQRDLLLTIMENAQRREAEAERTIKLLLLPRLVQGERVEQARALAALK